ncbi:MAG: hypothetical protein F6K31_42855 [Symploca sp. SIO2G7]|nr:hypothetical protein [Symploca sp. SIO2G7]
MTTTQVALDKKTYPLMMHLSIVPKYDIADESPSYDPSSQTSNITAMSNSWCTRSTSTDQGFLSPRDEDQKEDD